MFGREGNGIKNEKRGFQAGGKEARWAAWAWGCGCAAGEADGYERLGGRLDWLASRSHLLLHGAENTVVVFVHTISRRGMVMIELVFVD